MVVGIAVAVAFSSTFGQVLAYALISSGAVLATALVFYEVGLSEDKERALTAQRQREAAAKSRSEAHPATSQERRPGSRLERMRGSRRRLG